MPKRSIRPLLCLHVLVLLWIGLAGCSVVRASERRMSRTLDRAGLLERTWEHGSQTIHYWRGGSGPPLLLLHGFGGDARWQWHRQAAAFVDTHTLIIPDLPGFGASSWSGDTPSLEQQADAMASLLDHLGTSEAAVVGISYGGLVAWQLARRHPDRVARLALVGSPGPAYEREDLESLLRRFGERNVADIVIPRDPAGVRRLLELAYARPPSPPDWVLRQIHRDMIVPRQRDQRALMADLEGDLERYAAQRDPPSMPVLLVWGRDDPVFPLAIGRRLQRLWSDTATLVVIDETRHAPNLEQPVPFNRALDSFLRADERVALGASILEAASADELAQQRMPRHELVVDLAEIA